jgi:hypothetical protein
MKFGCDEIQIIFGAEPDGNAHYVLFPARPRNILEGGSRSTHEDRNVVGACGLSSILNNDVPTYEEELT